MPRALIFAVTLLGFVARAAPSERAPLTIDDLFEMRAVGEPRLSPDGAWVAYTVTTIDAEADGRDTDIYMSPVGGGDEIQLTTSSESESRPRFSPDGRSLAFLSSRESEHTQVWLLDRRGGEARQLTKYESGVSGLAWAPDSRRLALVIADPEPATEEDDQPIVVKRLVGASHSSATAPKNPTPTTTATFS